MKIRKARFKNNIHLWESGVEQMRGLDCIVHDESDSMYFVRYWLSNRECSVSVPKQYIEIIETESERLEVEPGREVKPALDTDVNGEPNSPKPKQKPKKKIQESEKPRSVKSGSPGRKTKFNLEDTGGSSYNPDRK